ncbi:hypothetical protein GQ457_18G017040 [Hibiscus cannabinus]
MELAITKLISEKKSLGVEGNREASLQVDTRFDCFRLVFVRHKEDRGRLIYEVFYAGMISFTCMDFNNGNGPTSNGHMALRHSPYQSFSKGSLRWLDVRVFYVRVSKCETDDESTPTYLTLNHVPLNPDTLLEVNGVRTGIYSDGASTLLRRDRVDKKSEEATFVSTDSIRLTGSVKFEVFNKDALLLSGVLELYDSNGCTELSRDSGSMWSMNCESAIPSSTGFLKAKHGPGSASPTVEVYVAGSFSGSPIILTRTLQPSLRKKQMKGMLDSIPEYEATEDQKEVTPFQIPDYLIHKPEGEEHSYMHSEVDYFDGEDGELSWFNAGVRVGVGIGLSICVGIGLGVDTFAMEVERGKTYLLRIINAALNDHLFFAVAGHNMTVVETVQCIPNHLQHKQL